MKGLAPTLTPFGARLAVIRQIHRWNIKQAATICEVPPATWRAWERDEGLPRDYMGVCRRIAERADIDLDWLVMGPGDDVTSWLLPPLALAG